MARILITNDQAELLEACQLVLESFGHQVETCCRPDEVIDRVAETQPDLIIIDLVMPEMSGDAVLRQLRSRRDTAHLPVLIMSALHTGPAIARRDGADGFLAKPFSAEELESAVQTVLRKGPASSQEEAPSR
jgi:DNA-binding response OmpR family regulator